MTNIIVDIKCEIYTQASQFHADFSMEKSRIAAPRLSDGCHERHMRVEKSWKKRGSRVISSIVISPRSAGSAEDHPQYR